MLWRATGDVEHLEDARGFLDGLVENAPEEYRASVVSGVALHRAVVDELRAARDAS